jgi:hypothetical protein
MPNVTATLKSILVDQMRRVIDGQTALRMLLAEVQRQVLMELLAAPAESYSSFQLKQTLAAIDVHLAGFEQSARSTMDAGITAAWDAGKTMLPELATAAGMQLNTYWLSSHLLDSLKEFAFNRISAVTNDAQAKIRAELSLGILGQKTPHEITSAISGTLEHPGVFKGITERAEVITKVEIGRAFSMATEKSLEASLDVLPDLRKMWLHAGHPKRARIYHLNLNGHTVPVEEKFLVGSISMSYPRDPTAPASEVVGCGCIHVPYLPAWGSEKAFIKAWNEAQTAANKPKGK